MIEKYANHKHINASNKTKMKVLNFKMLEKYAKFCEMFYIEGKSLLKS